ncbi:MAG: hypothetical protein AAF986_05175, partial [Pseudomonadota bacterium]
MKLSSKIRGGLLLTSACIAIASCSGSGGVKNGGGTGPVDIVPGTPGTPGPSTPDNSLDFVTAACSAGDERTVTTTSGVSVLACVISDNITENTTFAAGNVYLLDGTIFVGTQTGATPIVPASTATLTIEPGVIVAGLNGEDALVVSPGSQINADGQSPSTPIIFTSLTDLLDADLGDDTEDRTALEAASDGVSGGSSTARGQWGGLVINGLAPINDCENGDSDPSASAASQAACVKEGEGGSGFFGGNDPTDNSGTLRYIRVQYAGFLFSTDDELNGIAFQGVGNGTEVDFIQVHNNADDGVEFFGGTVNANHVVVTGAGDDSIDWTDGWTGNLQYALVVQTPGDANRGIEGDNRDKDNAVAPQSSPNVANFTLVTNFGDNIPGPDAGGDGPDDGIKVREGTGGFLANGIVNGFIGEGLDFDDTADYTVDNPVSEAGPQPTIVSTFISQSGATADGNIDNGDSETIFAAGSNNVETNGSTLDGVFAGEAEKAVTAADLSSIAGLDNVSFIGAFADNETSIANSWLAGWTLTAPIPDNAADACPTGTTLSGTAVPSGRSEARVCTLGSLLTGDVRLTNGNLYELNGTVFVGNDQGADPANPIPATQSGTLTIDPGVTLFGLNGEDALVVSRGSQIFSNGTAGAPVVMTSLQDLQGTATLTSRGQWGGLVINGRAQINDCENGDADPTASAARQLACEKEGEGGSGFFGGNTADDNSGSLTYTRVQYAGFLFSTDDELNGIAFQGVG